MAGHLRQASLQRHIRGMARPTILADENTPFGREAFGTLGEMRLKHGRQISRADLADVDLLVDALTGPRGSAPVLRALIGDGERMSFSALVFYEWLCGPRHPDEIRIQEALFPAGEAAPFGRPEAALASELYRLVRRRGRDADTDTATMPSASESDPRALPLGPAHSRRPTPPRRRRRR